MLKNWQFYSLLALILALNFPIFFLILLWFGMGFLGYKMSINYEQYDWDSGCAMISAFAGPIVFVGVLISYRKEIAKSILCKIVDEN